MNSQSKKLITISGVIIGLLLVGWIWFGQNGPYYPEINSTRPFRGNKEAKIKVIEYSDFQCPACLAAQPMVKDVISTFGDKISFEYKHFPLVAVHTVAFRGALAAECANDQGKFWEYHDKLFENQPNFSSSELISYADALKLKEPDFSSCLESGAKKEVVRADMAEGDRLGIDSTPTFFLNGEKLSNWSKLKELIQAKLIGG